MFRRDLLRALAGLGLAGLGGVDRATAGQGAAAARRRSPGPLLLAGAARVDITPVQPIALEGYQNPETRIATGIHDRLFARAIAFSAGDRRLVFVSCDLTSFMFGPYFHRTLADRHGFRPGELWLCATHTHSGPQLSLNASYPHPNNFEFTRGLEQRLVRVVGEALAGLSRARLALGRGRSMVGMSRRKIVGPGEVAMAPNPDGPADPELLVLRLSRPGGKPFAALFDYACHSRSLRAPNRLVSGDVFGIAEQAVERAGGSGLVAAAFAGASGDVDPARVVDGFEASPGEVPETVRLGSLLGDEAWRTIEAATDLPDRAPIRTESARVMLPRKTPGGEKPVEVTGASLGDIAFVGLDCEASVEIGLAVKAASPFAATFVLTHCNGWGGYLPVRHQYAEGGYEVAHTGFAPDAAEALVRSVAAMLVRLRSPRP